MSTGVSFGMSWWHPIGGLKQGLVRTGGPRWIVSGVTQFVMHVVYVQNCAKDPEVGGIFRRKRSKPDLFFPAVLSGMVREREHQNDTHLLSPQRRPEVCFLVDQS